MEETEKKIENKDFAEGVILDENRKAALLYRADLSLYQIQFGQKNLTEEEIEKRQEHTVVREEDGTVKTTVTLREDTMRGLIHLYFLKMLNDQGIDLNQTEITGYSIDTKKKAPPE